MRLRLRWVVLLLLPLYTIAQQPKLVIPIGHSSQIIDGVYSPDGRTIITGSWDNTIKLWERSSGALLHTFRGHKEELQVMKVSPNGQFIASGASDGTAKLWDARNGRLLFTFSVESTIVLDVAFSSNGRQLLVGDSDNQLSLWDCSSGENIFKIDAHTDGVHAVTFSNNDRYLISGGHDKEVKIWDARDGSLVRKMSGHEFWIDDLVCSPDDKLLISISADNTARLWNINNGELIHTLSDHEGSVRAASFSKDGKLVATASDDQTAKVWDVKSGALLNTLAGHGSDVSDVSFSPDDRLIATSSHDGAAKIWDRTNGQLKYNLKGHESFANSVDFSPDGKELLVTAIDNTSSIWEAATGKLSKKLVGHTSSIGGVDFSPDGKRMLTGGEGQVRVWDAKSGQLIHSLIGPYGFIQGVEYSKSGDQFLAICEDDKVRIWDANTFEPIKEITDGGGSLNDATFSPDGTLILTGSLDQKAKLFNLESGRLIKSFIGHTKDVATVAFSPDGREILTSSWEGESRIWDLETTRVLRSFRTNAEGQGVSIYSPDGAYVLTGNFEGAIQLWDAKTGQLIRTFNNNSMYLYKLAFTPGGDGFLSTGIGNVIKLWDLSNPEPVHVFSGHSSPALDLDFSPDGKTFISGSQDNTLKIWSLEKRAEIGTLVPIDQTDWAVINSEGLFDATPGAMSLMYYTIGTKGNWEIIELDQLKNRYYEPGLLPKLLGVVDEQIRPVEGFENVELFPELDASIRGNQLSIQLKPRSGGIGKVSVFMNGKEIIEEANPLSAGDNPQRSQSMNINLKEYENFLFGHPDSTDIINIYTYNAGGWLKSQPTKLVYNAVRGNAKGSGSNTGSTPWVGKLDPKLFVVSIGTSNYTGTELDLKYADQDATVMAKALHSIGSTLFTGVGSLEVACLSTASKDSTGLEGSKISWQFATKANIRKTFNKIKRQAKAEDIIMVYLSGHGVTYAGQDQAQFYYLTQGIANEDLSDPAIRKTYTISSEELTKWINAIPALKQVLVIDACNSGKVVESLTANTRSLNTSQVRALDRMKDRTGMFILSGSAADKVSYEASEYGQGLLTYALLQGMLGVAARRTANGDYIDVMKLFQYARDEVPRLAESINGIQRPMLGFPKEAASFDIGIFNQTVQIPIAKKKPVVIRSHFMNELTLKDDLKLEDLLEEEFRKETEEGRRADLIYVDVSEYPKAFSLGGLYKNTGDNISIKVKLFEDGQNPVDLNIRATNDPKRLSRYIVRELKKVLRSKGY